MQTLPDIQRRCSEIQQELKSKTLTEEERCNLYDELRDLDEAAQELSEHNY